MRRFGGIRIEYWILGSLLALTVLSTLVSGFIDAEKADGEWWAEWFQGFSAEMMGAALVFLILELVMSQMRYSDLREQQQARLRARLNKARATSTRQVIVDEMHDDDLLRGTDLTNADLSFLDLTQMDFTRANLKGADLREADMYQAILFDVAIDPDTILPDGAHWTPEVDLRRYTDSSSGEYWRSQNDQSPAYQSADT